MLKVISLEYQIIIKIYINKNIVCYLTYCNQFRMILIIESHIDRHVMIVQGQSSQLEYYYLSLIDNEMN